VKELAPNTPVIVGVGFEQEPSEDPSQCAEAWQLMVRAVRRAAADAGSETLLGQIESISVPQGMWEYRNPGRLIADALGCPSARSILSDLGVLQLSLLSDLCRAIVAGEQHVGVITGGEAKFRELRGAITGQTVANTEQPPDTPPPDVHHTSSDPWASDLEARAGLASPVELFAIVESALRHRQGLGVEEHRDRIAQLYSRFSEVAAGNPHAWRREPLSAQAIRDPSLRSVVPLGRAQHLHHPRDALQAGAVVRPAGEGHRAGDGPRARLCHVEIPREGLDRRGKAAVQLCGVDVPGRDTRQRERPLAGQHGARVRVQ